MGKRASGGVELKLEEKIVSALADSGVIVLSKRDHRRAKDALERAFVLLEKNRAALGEIRDCFYEKKKKVLEKPVKKARRKKQKTARLEPVTDEAEVEEEDDEDDDDEDETEAAPDKPFEDPLKRKARELGERIERLEKQTIFGGGDLEKKIYAAIKAGATSKSSIAEKSGIDYSKLGSLLKNLSDAGILKREGEKKSTKYSLAGS